MTDRWGLPPLSEGGWHSERGTDPDGRAGWALFSYSRRYRFALARTWDPALPVLAVVGLNPSTAGASSNDQTVRQCIGFAAREGCGSLVMVNLHALVATDPGGLLAAPPEDRTGGPVTDWAITEAVATARNSGGKVVLGWGAHGDRFPHRAGVVLGLVYREGVTPWALGFTRSGQPRHPCRLGAGTPLLAMPF